MHNLLLRQQQVGQAWGRPYFQMVLPEMHQLTMDQKPWCHSERESLGPTSSIGRQSESHLMLTKSKLLYLSRPKNAPPSLNDFCHVFSIWTISFFSCFHQHPFSNCAPLSKATRPFPSDDWNHPSSIGKAAHRPMRQTLAFATGRYRRSLGTEGKQRRSISQVIKTEKKAEWKKKENWTTDKLNQI